MQYPQAFIQPYTSPASEQLAHQCWQHRRWCLPVQPLSERHLASPFALDNKATLARWCQQHCPHLHPQTYVADELSIAGLAARLAKHHASSQQWLLKPVLRNNGEGIFRASTTELHDAFYRLRQYTGKHVIQRFIEPMLWQDHAFSLRMLVVVTNTRQGFYWPMAYINQCLQPYDQHYAHTYMTNEHGQGQGRRCSRQCLASEWPHFAKQLPALVDFLRQLCLPFNRQGTSFHPRLGLWGIDFIWDVDGRPWLLEVNQGPCFPRAATHPLQQSYYQPFWQAVMVELVEPLLALVQPQPDRLKLFL